MPAVPCCAILLDAQGTCWYPPCRAMPCHAAALDTQVSAGAVCAVPCRAMPCPWVDRVLLMPAVPCCAIPLDAQGTCWYPPCRAIPPPWTDSPAVSTFPAPLGGIFPIGGYLCSPRCPLDPQPVCQPRQPLLPARSRPCNLLPPARHGVARHGVRSPLTLQRGAAFTGVLLPLTPAVGILHRRNPSGRLVGRG